ncbi:MAG TPA: hypothetical protein PLK12_07625 [Prolixibacteraceae bacterium]|nr:hypothetical protein [Prolixibacteraceae bacterium]
MLKVFVTFFLYFTVVLTGLARSNVFPSGARAAGMGNAVTGRYDASALFHNPAGIAQVEERTLLADYATWFRLPALSQPALAIILPSGSGVFALHASTFGPASWLETHASLTYAKTILPAFSVALQFHYYGHVLPEENCMLSSAGFSAGLLWQCSPALRVGLSAGNPWSLPIRTLQYNERIPWSLRGGVAWTIQKGLLATAEAEFAQNPSFNGKVGLEWEALDSLFFRWGINSHPSALFAGFGFSLSIVEIDFALQFHQRLGYRSFITLCAPIR